MKLTSNISIGFVKKLKASINIDLNTPKTELLYENKLWCKINKNSRVNSLIINIIESE